VTVAKLQLKPETREKGEQQTRGRSATPGLENVYRVAKQSSVKLFADQVKRGAAVKTELSRLLKAEEPAKVGQRNFARFHLDKAVSAALRTAAATRPSRS